MNSRILFIPGYRGRVCKTCPSRMMRWNNELKGNGSGWREVGDWVAAEEGEEGLMSKVVMSAK